MVTSPPPLRSQESGGAGARTSVISRHAREADMESAIAFNPDVEARAQLLERRERLERAITGVPDARPFARLLDEVDAALARVERGTFGLCEVCHDTVEPERIAADPLVRACLSCLTAAEQRAL